MPIQSRISFDLYFSSEDKKLIRMLITLALEEDIGEGDITTKAITKYRHISTARLIAKQSGIICGLPLISMILEGKTKKYSLKLKLQEGSAVRLGQVVAEIKAPSHILLEVERVLLNFLQRLSGIATLTRKYVDAVKSSKAVILDTRKTTPLLRLLEKYAVCIGGGTNHRYGLYDQILIKDNHISIAGGMENAVLSARRKYPGVSIEVEARSLKEVRQAMMLHPEIILLDNMSLPILRQAVRIVKNKALTEASGGIHLKNIRQIAATGVDRISIGALTHSAPALDLSLKIVSIK